MSDLRIAAALEVASPETFETELIIAALNHRFVFGIGAGEVSVALQSNDGANIDRATAAFSPTGAFEFECIHVDQKLQLRVDGELLVELKYEWSPVERLENAYRAFNLDRYIADASSQSMRAVALKWSFEASPLAMRRVRVDRDLYYKPGRLAPLQQAAANGETIEGPLFATNPKEPAVLGDDHYLMLGDNSSFSRDGRYWGRPHPLVVSTIGDDTPFVAHRDLLVGKAWCVYFPAPGRLSPGGPAVVPDFGRLRFIR